MENRLQFRGILPLTPRPVSGYNSPSLRTGRRRPGWGDPDENGDIEETVPAGAKTDPGGGELARPGGSGAPGGGGWRLPRLIRRAFPSIEKVRLVSSGTEAAMSAVRLARGVTGRGKIVKVEGGCHGHARPVLGEARVG